MNKQLDTQEIGLGQSPALLVVDASLGFTDPSSPLGANYTQEITNIAKLISHAHTKGWPCFFSSVVYHSEDQASVFRQKLPALNELAPGSDYIKIDPQLPMSSLDRLFEKQHASCFFATKLAQWLTESGIDTVVITGFTTSGCVRASAVDSLQHNFRTLVVEDAVGDRDADAHAANLKDLRLKYTDVVTTDYLLAL